ncbi:MAG: ZIP family metal transporter [Sulfitobacter sp.]|nr:ZIP family metal transporter [Sulfitobacter sp.]
MDLSLFTMGLLGSFIAGAMTAVGALPVLLGRTLGGGLRDLSLGFAAGVMLSASFFSLILPALDRTADSFGEGLLAPTVVAIAILIGMAGVAALNEVLPHEHFNTGREGPEAASLRRLWLFIIAISIHNFPEGLAVGVGFGAEGVETGLPLAIGIGVQNAPEGLAVAVALLGVGYDRFRAWAIAAATGMVEPLGGAIGAGLVSLSQPLLPWALGAAAGAMIFVISHEIIPETHRRGHQKLATFGLSIGLVVMLVLDVWLG